MCHYFITYTALRRLDEILRIYEDKPIKNSKNCEITNPSILAHDSVNHERRGVDK